MNKHLLGAVIERSFKSSMLSVLLFFLSPDSRNWTSEFDYHIQHTSDPSTKSYIKKCHYAQSLVHSSEHIDDSFVIVRCPFSGAYAADKSLVNSKDILVIYAMQAGRTHFECKIPWRTRSTMIISSSDVGESWGNLNGDKNNSKNITVNLCAFVNENYIPDDRNIASYLEFVQHHLSVGISHIYLITQFEENSKEILRLHQIFRSYILENTLSIWAKSSDMAHRLFSHQIRSLSINMCLYLSKGVADYVGVWDLDEFFIPKLPHNNIIDVISSAAFVVKMKVNVIRVISARISTDPVAEFIGKRQYIIRNQLQESVRSSINSYIFSVHQLESLVGNYTSDISSTHLKITDFEYETDLAILYRHITLLRFPWEKKLEGVRATEYSDRFFPEVLRQLTQRDLDIVVTLPIRTLKLPPDATNWTNYEQVYHNAMKHRYQLLDEFQSLDTYPGASSIAELPAMTADLSELVLGSLLERSFDDDNLTLTTFMLGHEMLNSDLVGLGARMVRNDLIHMWEMAIAKWEGTLYTSSGQRVTPPDYYCRISHSNSSQHSMTYVVKGAFVPNRLTPDQSSNRRLDILRCPMHGSQAQYKDLIRSDEHLLVEILRERDSLINFTVPWRSRKTGLMLSLPPQASMFDSWKGYGASSPSNSTKLTVHMCTPGMETPPGRRILPLFLEFIQHHLLLGVDHIFLSANFHWGSRRMITLLRLFRTYISEGSVTMASQAGDNVDYMASVYGIYWKRNVLKLMQINMCLYLSKGVADYVGVWDLDEFFIPRLPYNNMIDVIRSMESTVPISYPDMNGVFSSTSKLWRGGPGLADGDGHPFCYISLQSVVLLQRSNDFDDAHPWIGQRFTHGPEGPDTNITRRMGFKKLILPTRNILQAGLHDAGGCVMPVSWNPSGFNLEQRDNISFLYNNHLFNETVWDRDSKVVNRDSEAVIYHYYSTHRQHYPVSMRPVSIDALNRENEYVKRFFEGVMNELTERDLIKYVSLPVTFDKQRP